MTLPGVSDLFAVLDATWPAADLRRVGPWAIRDGQGGGQRVSAATAEAAVTAGDIPVAERAMTALGQPPLFMLRPEDDTFDAMLGARGYRIHDPVVLYAVDIAQLTEKPVPPVSAFAIWPPLAIMADLWAEGGIGPERLRVMDRAKGPKTAILARHSDQPAGTAFVACHDGVAMIHAIEVSRDLRRQGVGANILRAAAHWAQNQALTHLTLAVTRANAPANALYASLGMQLVGHYHYRIKQGATRPEQ